MNARALLIAVGVALCLPTQAADQPPAPQGGPQALKGEYRIYGGELGDTVPPTARDRKVAFTFKGPLARDLFDHIGPDKKGACGAAPDHRIRDRGDLTCVWDKRDGYTCYFGLNVPTGKGMYGSIC